MILEAYALMFLVLMWYISLFLLCVYLITLLR